MLSAPGHDDAERNTHTRTHRHAHTNIHKNTKWFDPIDIYPHRQYRKSYHSRRLSCCSINTILHSNIHMTIHLHDTHAYTCTHQTQLQRQRHKDARVHIRTQCKYGVKQNLRKRTSTNRERMYTRDRGKEKEKRQGRQDSDGSEQKIIEADWFG